MWNLASKKFGFIPDFDPELGVLVKAPLQDEYGFWMGAPSVIFDPRRNLFYMAYRVRVHKERGRGIACRLAESADGQHFKDVGEISQKELGTPSIEKSALFQLADGRIRLYVSYVDPVTSRWRIDSIDSQSLDAFDVDKRLSVMAPDSLGLEGIKDPVVFQIGSTIYMFAQCLPNREKISSDILHGTQDGFATGLTHVESRLYRSRDGLTFEDTGSVLGPSVEGWDSLARRVTTIIKTEPGFAILYDGKATPLESYEEKVGIAWTQDFRDFDVITVDSPWCVSPHASGACRYVDALRVGSDIFYYYEMANSSRSHGLYMTIVKG